ncbi:hypothetical protein PV327_003966 [Microctonus hyperodae]|uniref:Uncharacterized protein n=1 Tax=Microctonus hyperodae TaxID=165561 RepID=A0AA39L1F3_MICHY|nr:hypothetical protein PV327_003966 [Microctonus hyperodae]
MADVNKIDNLQKASLINNEIKKGESDEKSIKSRTKSNNPSLYDKKSSTISSDKKIVNTRKEEICREKLYAREAAKAPKTIRVPVCTKTCTPTKRNYIPRNCMTKEEWMTLLSKPNQKCSPHFHGFKEKILKAMPTRINELAQPPRQRMIATLQDRGTILPAPLVDRLITVLEAESCLTPEQAEKLFRAKRKKKKRKGKRKKSEKKSEQPIPTNQQFQYDKDAAICQYLMAESFIKSILQWECTIPKEDFQDIAEVVFSRVKQLFNRNAVDNDERGSQQMRLLADIIAAWIAGILFEVAQLKEDELKKECEERKKTLDENIEDDDDSIIDMQIISDDDSTKRDDDDDVVDDDVDNFVDDVDDDIEDDVDDENDEDDDDDDDEDDDSEADDDDSDDENSDNNYGVTDDDDDDNNEDGDGDHGIVVDDVEDKKDEDEFHEVENEENNDEQIDGKETLQVLIDDTVDEKMKAEDKIQNEVIEEYTLAPASRRITSIIFDETKWYNWQQCMGSRPFRMEVCKNLVNQNDDSLAILDEHDVMGSQPFSMGVCKNLVNQNDDSLAILDAHDAIKNDEANYSRNSIVGREINPNL